MRIKITEPGWAGFSDKIGAVQFTDGISDEDVPEQVLHNIAASIRVVEYRGETASGKERLGVQQGFAAAAVRNKDLPAPVEAPLAHASPNPPPADPRLKPISTAKYSFNDLAAVADAKGIKGLREIGNEFGVSGRAINELIQTILKKQEQIAHAAANKARNAEMKV